MKRIFPFLALAAAPLCGRAQTALHSDGGSIHIAAGGQVYVAGDMNNGTGSTLVNDGVLTVTGAFSNDAPMASPAAGTLRFNGTGPQTLSGATPYFARDVEVANPAGIVLGAGLKVDGIMTFSSGVIDATNPAYPVVFTANGSVSTPSDASHINGYVVKEGAGSFIYPTGDAGKYQPVAVDLSANSAGLTARYYPADAGSAAFGTGGNSAVPLLYYNMSEYWDLSPAGTAAGSVTLFWDGYNDRRIGNTADLRVAHKTAGEWMNEGAAAVSGTTASGSVTSDAVSTWSPFALGSISSASPLPVQLLRFTAAAAAGASNRLDWQTGVESGLSGFEVERSGDGREFVRIGRLDPKGGSAAYSFYDNAPLSGTSFYRLRMPEGEGASYSQILSLSRGSLVFSLYPNPVTDAVHIQASEAGELVIRDMSGRIVSRTSVAGTAVISLQGVAPGIYTASYQSATHTESLRLIRK